MDIYAKHSHTSGSGKIAEEGKKKPKFSKRMRQFAERLCLQVSSEAILSFKKHDAYLKILSGIIVAHCTPQLVSVKHAAHLYLLSFYTIMRLY